jgi:simple sugar transport system permease protein
VGGNKDAAIAIGINASRVKIIAFIAAPVGATIAAIISTTRVRAISPFQSSMGLELDTIAACVIGGLFLTGGRGSVIGIVLGAILIYLVEDILLLTGAPSFYLEAFVGAVIVGAVVMNTWVARRSF